MLVFFYEPLSAGRTALLLPPKQHWLRINSVACQNMVTDQHGRGLCVNHRAAMVTDFSTTEGLGVSAFIQSEEFTNFI